jgi:hypothetical protein
MAAGATVISHDGGNMGVRPPPQVANARPTLVIHPILFKHCAAWGMHPSY